MFIFLHKIPIHYFHYMAPPTQHANWYFKDGSIIIQVSASSFLPEVVHFTKYLFKGWGQALQSVS
jgi:hypothetical protein